MRLRHIPGAKDFVAAHPLVIGTTLAPTYQGKWQQLFESDNPLHLEVGMGRGKFIASSAYAFPDINFIGLEVVEEVIFKALERYPELPPNVHLLWLNAGLLSTVFAKGEVEKIYLNFPDPWPKARHAKRRLTAASYLAQYRDILADKGSLRFKTDNPDLFAWSEDSFRENGWQQIGFSRDLPIEQSGIISEYETRYRSLKQPIYFSEWRK